METKLTMPIARKNHYCFLFGRLIPKGDRYARNQMYDDDGYYDQTSDAIKEHTNCELYKHMPKLGKAHGVGNETQ